MRCRYSTKRIVEIFFIILFPVICLGCYTPSSSALFTIEKTHLDNEGEYEDTSNNNEAFEIDIRSELNGVESLYVSLPEYKGDPAVSVNNDIPWFIEEEIISTSEVIYSELDYLGRCGPAVGRIGQETLPTAERGPILDVKPSGWHTVRYDDRIEDRYLYNRCHLIGYQLAGANAEPRNLITGTRYLNIEGMLPYENIVFNYIIETGNHVLYRVTPVFEEDNLVVSGILMEAYSIEDSGIGVRFCRYIFNVQPGVIIDYKTGDNWEDDSYIVERHDHDQEVVMFDDLSEQGDYADPIKRTTSIEDGAEKGNITYVLNNNTMRFHLPKCPSVEDIKPKNIEYSTESREMLIGNGYMPCGRCNP